jgi:hypothetical protein
VPAVTSGAAPSPDVYVGVVDAASRYAHALDARDWDALGECFTHDAVAEYAAFETPVVGRDAIVAAIREGCRRYDVTQHLVGSPIVRVEGDTVRAAFYVIAQHVKEKDGDTVSCLVGASYVDEVVRTDAGWCFSRRRVRRLWTQGDASLLPPDHG